jgi:hypothetical protein
VRVILTLLIAPGFAFGFVAAAGELMKPTPAVSAEPTSLVWGDRVFSHRRELAGWLQARGASYKDWAALHPAASSVFDGSGNRIVSKGPATSTRPTASARPVPAESKQTALAIGVAIASLLGVLGLFATLRLRRPHAARAGPSRPSVTPSARRKPRLGGVQLLNAGATIAASTASAITGTRRGSAALEQRVAGQRAATAATAHAMTLRRPVHLHTLAHMRRSLVHGLARSLIGAAKVVERTLSALRGAWAALERRRAARADEAYDRSVTEYDAIFARAALRRRAPDIALYVTSVLLAVVIGASLALYLN